jgi:microcystin degradation protein MlrC
MPTRILIAECMQEISSFNPLPSHYENFSIQRGNELLSQRGLNTSVAGALSIFEDKVVEVVPTYSAKANSAGPLSAKGWEQLSGEFLAAVKAKLHGIDGIYISFHGAMGAQTELDPEGYLLAEVRRMVGPDMPIVISLDLHGILTDRMLRQINGLAIYHTYPHVDFADTGERAANLLLRLIDEDINPVIARVVMPALVRGDELITKTGCYGELIARMPPARGGGAGARGRHHDRQSLHRCAGTLLAGADHDGWRQDIATREAVRLAEEFWPLRFRMQGKLVPLERAIAQARSIDGPVIFTDAADATSSGASGDSNAILAALRAAGYGKRVLAQIVDAPAAAAAHVPASARRLRSRSAARSIPCASRRCR